MSKFKSGIILKNDVILTPLYNESISDLLKTRGAVDVDSNVQRDSTNNELVFVRAELVPQDGDILSDVSSWIYEVKQDTVPDWYKDNPKNYENRFRASVKKWRDENIFDVCGIPCTKLKIENGCTYYHVCVPLFNTKFGDTNDYRSSNLRRKLLSSDFAKSLIKEFGENLFPTSIDLTAMDGLKNYGRLDGDLLAIPDINFYRECRENIFCGNERWWSSTPDTTISGGYAFAARVINDGGDVDWAYCDTSSGARPFFIVKDNEKKLTNMSFF